MTSTAMPGTRAWEAFSADAGATELVREASCTGRVAGPRGIVQVAAARHNLAAARLSARPMPTDAPAVLVKPSSLPVIPMRLLVSNPDTLGDLVLRQPMYRALAAAGH